MGFDDVFKHLDLDGDGKVNTVDEIRQLVFGDMMCQPAAPNRPYGECQAKLPCLCFAFVKQTNKQTNKHCID